MSKDPVVSRLNRIQGQINAVKRMYEEEDDCVSVVQQIQAARSAMAKVAQILLSDEASRCVEKGDTKKLKQVVDRTFKVN